MTRFSISDHLSPTRGNSLRFKAFITPQKRKEARWKKKKRERERMRKKTEETNGKRLPPCRRRLWFYLQTGKINVSPGGTARAGLYLSLPGANFRRVVTRKTRQIAGRRRRPDGLIWISRPVAWFNWSRPSSSSPNKIIRPPIHHYRFRAAAASRKLYIIITEAALTNE